MSHKISLSWAGGEHDFALGLGQLRALQTACDAGPERILRNMASGDWRVDDVIETLRLGLMGAGMDTKTASGMVLRLVELHSWTEFKETAYRVLGAALVGVTDDPVGERSPAPGAKAGESGNSLVTTEPGQ